MNDNSAEFWRSLAKDSRDMLMGRHAREDLMTGAREEGRHKSPSGEMLVTGGAIVSADFEMFGENVVSAPQ